MYMYMLLFNFSEFRYVPVELPTVELPPYARKYPCRKKRANPNPKHTANAAGTIVSITNSLWPHSQVLMHDLGTKLPCKFLSARGYLLCSKHNVEKLSGLSQSSHP